MCITHIKLSKLKGHLTPPLPSLILSLLLSSLHTHMNFPLFFSCWDGSFSMFCHSAVALGCKRLPRAARRGMVGYLIWCEKGWWMLFACCVDVQTAVWTLPRQRGTVSAWLTSKQVDQIISALAHFAVLGEPLSSVPWKLPQLTCVRAQTCFPACAAPPARRLLGFMAVIC